MTLTFEKKIKISFSLIFIGIVLIGIVTFRVYKSISDTDSLVQHTHKVITESEQVLSGIQNMVLSSGGYIITDDPAFLKQVAKSNGIVSVHLNKLKDLSQDDLMQQARIELLSKLIQERIAFSIQTIDFKQKNGFEQTKVLIKSGKGKKSMDEIIQTVYRIQKEENDLLLIRQETQSENFKIFNFSFFLLFGFVSILLSVLFFAIKHNNRAKKQVKDRLLKINKDLVRKNIHFNQSQDMLCTISLNGYLKEMNGSFERELGFSKQELRAQHFTSFVHPEDLEKTSSELKKIETGETNLNYTIRQRCKNGEYIWLHCNIVVFEGLMYATARNISLQKSEHELLLQQTNELLIMNKEIESFSYSVSHDLRIPLRAIYGYAEILLEDYSEKLDKEAKETIDVIFKNAHRMGELIDDLLAFSKLGRDGIKQDDVNMNAIAQAIIYELQLNNQEVKPIITIQPLLPATGDTSLLKQVLINLISNAIKYSRTKSEIKIEIGCEENETEVTYFVKDNGVGFDMQYYDKLFGVFQRLHGDDEFEGTGVGLAIVQKIVNRHGGRVWAEAEVNVGATFFFTLPKIEI